MSNLESTAPGAHAYLIAQLPTALGIQTFNRSALGTDLENERAVVGEITNLEQEWAGLGNSRRDESYEIQILISVTSGNDPTDADIDALSDTAWGFVQDIVNLLESDWTLGGNVIFAQVAKATENPIAMTGAGPEIAIEVTISCRAQVIK